MAQKNDAYVNGAAGIAPQRLALAIERAAGRSEAYRAIIASSITTAPSPASAESIIWACDATNHSRSKAGDCKLSKRRYAPEVSQSYSPTAAPWPLARSRAALDIARLKPASTFANAKIIGGGAHREYVAISAAAIIITARVMKRGEKAQTLCRSREASACAPCLSAPKTKEIVTDSQPAHHR